MTKQSKNPKSLVILTALGAGEEHIEELRCSFDDYYEESNELIDSSDYRRLKKIRVVKGMIYDSSRRLVQSFENVYDETGRLIRDRTVYDDGSVIEDEFKP